MIGSRSMNSHMLTTVVSKIFQGCPKFLFKMSHGCPKDPQSCLQVISQLSEGCPKVSSKVLVNHPKGSVLIKRFIYNIERNHAVAF